tara:strand:- start:382 stop:819 length:438 start_codon:yes stop_codon:yes gene_type:complete
MGKKPHPTRIFKTPEELEQAWENYKENVKTQEGQWEKVQYVGKDGARVTDGVKVPYTMAGFEVYCYKNYGSVHHYFDNKLELYNDFGTICRAIRTEIREHQIIGGMNGFFNPSITQRLNGLTDKKEIEHKGELNIPNVPDIGDRK